MKKALSSNQFGQKIGFLFFLLAFAGGLFGQASLSVQGVLTKSDGTAVDDGEYSITFKLWTAPGAGSGTAVHAETVPNVQTTGGVYSVVLGQNGTPINATFDQTYYLGVSVGGGAELLPRPRLTHAPYALSLLGQNNKFPSTGVVTADAINVAGAASANTLHVTGATSAGAFVAASGAPAANTAGTGYAFGSGGDEDGGLFSTANGTVSLYTNSVERVKVTDSQVELKGKALTANDAGGGGYAFTGAATSGLFLNNSEVTLKNNNSAHISLQNDTTVFNKRARFTAMTKFNAPISSDNAKIFFNKTVDITYLWLPFADIDYPDYNVGDVYSEYEDGHHDDANDADGEKSFTNIGLRVAANVLANGYIAASDRRIKKDFVRVNGAVSLSKLNQLQVTDYHYIDGASNGRGLRKGFIAQEVEEIEPAAINKSTNFIPSIYARAEKIQGGNQQVTLSMGQPHGLQKGDKVRIIAGAAQHDLIVETATATGFTVAQWCETVPGAAFVYGKEISDFRAVDYDYIFTMNVAATQELARRVELLEKENAALRAQNTSLENKQTEFGSQLSELTRRMKLLETSETGNTRK